MRTELIFAEIGNKAHPVNRQHFQAYFPEAQIREIVEGRGIGDLDHPRWGWRMNDYHKVEGLIDSEADIAIAFDADMLIISMEARRIISLAKTFGLCMPANPRKLVKVDNEVGADAQVFIPDEVGLMSAVNCGVIALDKKNINAVICAKTFLNIMESSPMRGPMAWAKAFWATGFSPCLLPPQWCVCAEDIGCGNEIILHTGHQKVKDYYASLV